jgi:hypothetical protein
LKATDERNLAAAGVKRKIFSLHRLVHTLSTFFPQLIHSPGSTVAPRDHFSISAAPDFRLTPPRFDLSREKVFAVSMMRAGRKQ